MDILSRIKRGTSDLPPRILLAGTEGIGKCLGRGTKVLMHDGSIKTAETIEVGDLLMGPDSKPRKVLSTVRGVGSLYSVRPKKGEPWVCNDAHLLTVVHSWHTERGWYEVPAAEYSRLPEHKSRYMLGVRTGVEFPEANLPLDPYFVGLWIGDGTLRGNGVQITKPDKEIREALVSVADTYGAQVKTRNDGIRCDSHKIVMFNRGESFRKNPIIAKLKECGHGGTEKIIPRHYLVSSRKQRLQLLAGLIDTDGYLAVAGGCFEISTKYDGLSDSIVFLARSLGFQVTHRLKKSTIKELGFSAYYHRILIAGDLRQIPTRVPKKQAKTFSAFKNRCHFGMTVTPIGDGEYFGFQLDGDKRFLLGDFSVTHNTTFAAKAPNPIFLAPEDGLTGFDHLSRFVPSSLDDLHQFLDLLVADARGYQSLVVDSSDWLERLIAQSMCKRDDKSDIEDYGYGKGYVVLENELVRVLQKLDTIRQKHRLWIILLSHVQIRIFNDPRGPSYDRFEMKGHKKFTGILREWPDCNLFAVYEVNKVKVKGQQKEQAVGGDRVMHTNWSPAWDAKNRLNLPEVLPLEWEAFEQAIRDNSVSSLAAKVRSLYSAAAAKVPEAEKPKWEKAMAGLDTMTADRLQSAITKLEAMK